MNEKTYLQYLEGISATELYDGFLGAGLFAEVLPPVFTSLAFLAYCKEHRPNFPRVKSPYVQYENIRNNNTPRQMGVPNPFSYEILCAFLRDHWTDIKNFFAKHTSNQTHKVSQIHLKKMKGTAMLFKMNYHTKSENCDPPIPRLLSEGGFSSQYEAMTDVSSCFPSVYSHALVWALESKEWAKQNKKDQSLWQNQLDSLVRNLKFGETNGLLIGPHASNLLADIVLTRVDEQIISRGYKCVRFIDDCKCFTRTKDDADRFVVDYGSELKKYGLLLNNKKTKIVKLPIVSEDDWVRLLNDYAGLLPKNKLELRHVRSLLDFVISLVDKTGNASAISYAMSIVKDVDMTAPARVYYSRVILHLASVYPYLYRFLDERLFAPFEPELPIIKAFICQMYSHGLLMHNFEEVAYSLYFSIRYGVQIEKFNVQELLDSGDCVLMVMAWLYSRQWHEDCSALILQAQKFAQDRDTFFENWIFAYEVLSENDFEKIDDYKEALKALKSAGVSFLLSEDEISAIYSRSWQTKRMQWDWTLSQDDNAGKNAVDRLFEEFLKEVSDADRQYRLYFEAIVGNLYIGRLLRYNIAISRSKSSYSRFHVLDAEGNIVDGVKVRRIVKWFVATGRMGERIGSKEEGCSYYWARNNLSDVFDAMDAKCVIPVSLKDVERPLVLLKDRNGKIVANPKKPFNISTYETGLHEINLFYSGRKFNFYPGRGMRRQSFVPSLHAIYNNMSWEQGGRMYAGVSMVGVNYQLLPSDVRETIVIDGHQTVECDYRGLHVAMLYAKENIQAFADPYGATNESMRPLWKKALVTIINAGNREEAIFSIRNACEELKGADGLSPRKQRLLKAYEECDGNVEHVIGVIEQFHHRIAKYFYTGIGLKLQAMDAQMAFEIVHHFMGKGVAVLPVHDSFIVRIDFGEELVEMMKDTFKKYNNNFQCEVTSKGA